MNFRIISTNIRFDTPQDKEHAWDHRKQILFDQINEFSPDLLGTQEGREPQLRDFESGVENLKMIDSHRSWIDERMYPTIYVNPAEVDVFESGDSWLSETPNVDGSSSFDSAFPRLFTWIKAKFKKSGKDFFYINTHFDHVKDSTRKEQVRVLIEEAKKINSTNLPIIISGDFNEAPDQHVHKSLISEMKTIYDPWIMQNNAEEGSFHKFNGDNEGNARIDWILVDFKMKTYDIFLDKKEKDGIYPSDHFIVKGNFEL